MRFGTDPDQVAEVQWQFCQPGAETLPYPTPFTSRDHDGWEIWPEIGEVQFAQRVNTPKHLIHVPGVGTSLLPGTHEPCGDPQVWEHGYPGRVPPDYPRNVFAESLCCAGFMGAAQIGILGYIVQPAVAPVPLTPSLPPARALPRRAANVLPLPPRLPPPTRAVPPVPQSPTPAKPPRRVGRGPLPSVPPIPGRSFATAPVMMLPSSPVKTTKTDRSNILRNPVTVPTVTPAYPPISIIGVTPVIRSRPPIQPTLPTVPVILAPPIVPTLLQVFYTHVVGFSTSITVDFGANTTVGSTVYAQVGVAHGLTLSTPSGWDLDGIVYGNGGEPAGGVYDSWAFRSVGDGTTMSTTWNISALNGFTCQVVIWEWLNGPTNIDYYQYNEIAGTSVTMGPTGTLAGSPSIGMNWIWGQPGALSGSLSMAGWTTDTIGSEYNGQLSCVSWKILSTTASFTCTWVATAGPTGGFLSLITYR